MIDILSFIFRACSVILFIGAILAFIASFFNDNYR